jgi:hypothetical protein
VLKNQGQFVMSLRSKPLKSFASDIYHRAPVAGGSAYTGLAATIGIDQRFTPCWRTASPASGMSQEQKDLKAKRKSQAGWSVATKLMPAGPLRIIFRAHN